MNNPAIVCCRTVPICGNQARSEKSDTHKGPNPPPRHWKPLMLDAPSIRGKLRVTRPPDESKYDAVKRGYGRSAQAGRPSPDPLRPHGGTVSFLPNRGRQENLRLARIALRYLSRVPRSTVCHMLGPRTDG